MKTVPPPVSESMLNSIRPVSGMHSFSTDQKNARKDIVFNVSLKDSLVRLGFTLVIPMLMLVVDKYWIIYTAPVVGYLFITVLARFCIVKYLWRRYIMHKPSAALPPYGEDQNFPEQSTPSS